MNIFIYDKTFDGFLTVVFESYDRKIIPDKILSIQEKNNFLWDSVLEVQTESSRCERVWDGLCKYISKEGRERIYRVFLSQMEGIEMVLFDYIRLIFSRRTDPEMDFGNPIVLKITKINLKVSHEANRIRMFVRFQKSLDDIYFAPFEPQYDVLPLITNHFKERFADQKWVIFDIRRKYGYFYDLDDVFRVTFTESTIDFKTGKIPDSALAKDEQIFQQLWKNYFKSIAIEERKNPKLHKQLLPKRFWKFLPEKS